MNTWASQATREGTDRGYLRVLEQFLQLSGGAMEVRFSYMDTLQIVWPLALPNGPRMVSQVARFDVGI